jgi:hypothetical protein
LTTTGNGRGGAVSATIPGADVYLLGNVTPEGGLLTDIRRGVPVVLVGMTPNAIIEESENRVSVLQKSGLEALLKAEYTNASLVVSNMQEHRSTYNMNNMLSAEPIPFVITSLPGFLNPVVKVIDDDNCNISGKVYPPGAASEYRNSTTVAAGVYNYKGNDIPMTIIVNNVFGKGGAQIYYRMIANAIFAYASGINAYNDAGKRRD